MKYLSLFLLLILSSCGYHTSSAPLAQEFHTLSIPYAKGDKNGEFTDSLIREMSRSGQWHVIANGGNLILETEILADTKTHIGYQYDRKPTSGRRINRLIPNEGRREMKVKFSLIDRATGRIVYGPEVVSADVDYDFIDPDSIQDASFINRSGVRQSLLSFSLGQLDSVEGASIGAKPPLYQHLSRKVAEGIAVLKGNHQ